MNHTLINATSMRKRMLGEISDMTLWRWLNDPETNFPSPIYIGRRRYWREAEISAWIDARAAACFAAEATSNGDDGARPSIPALSHGHPQNECDDQTRAPQLTGAPNANCGDQS